MFYFLNDHLGTPQKIVNASGRMVWQAVYQPFGEAQLRMAIVSCNLRFPGQYFDSESGLHYNWHRYYDPETGRYITADPIGLEGGINLYSYVLNNPVNGIDSSGLFSPSQKQMIIKVWTVTGSVAGTILGFIGGGGSGSLTGPVAVVAVPAGAIKGALAGAAIGGAFGNAIGNYLMAQSASSACSGSGNTQFSSKIQKQLSKRGWTKKDVDDTVANPYTTRPATNKATGGDATAYFRKDGSYVVRDNVTGDIIQVSNRLDPGWIPDPTIQNPYIP